MRKPRPELAALRPDSDRDCRCRDRARATGGDHPDCRGTEALKGSQEPLRLLLRKGRLTSSRALRRGRRIVGRSPTLGRFGPLTAVIPRRRRDRGRADIVARRPPACAVLRRHRSASPGPRRPGLRGAVVQAPAQSASASRAQCGLVRSLRRRRRFDRCGRHAGEGASAERFGISVPHVVHEAIE